MKKNIIAALILGTASLFINVNITAQETESKATEKQETKQEKSETAKDEAKKDAEKNETPKNMPAVQSYSVPVGKLKSIEVKLKSENLEFKISDTSDATIEILSNLTEANPTVTYNDKVIKIEQKDKTNKLENRKVTVRISLPKKFTVDALKSSADNAAVCINGIAAKNMSIELGSGTFVGENLTAENFTLSANTGNVSLKNIIADKCADISTASGTVSAEVIRTKILKASTQKGSANFSKISAASFEVSAGKGKLTAEFEKMITEKSIAETSSGEAKILLPSSAVFYTSANVGKGRFRSTFSSDSKGPLIECRAGSGDLLITKK